MKLLFDQNISYKLITALHDLFPGAAHVRQLGLHEADDVVIWDYARVNGFTILSKDDDFHQRSFVHGHPPKVIWLRVGNCTTDHIAATLRNRASDIAIFYADPQAAFLALA